MRLALFDLDNTLLPIDSDHAWAGFLARTGVIDGAEHARRNDEFYRQYQSGELIIEEFLAFQLAPLAQYSRAQLDAWHRQYMTECIMPHLHDSARALVDGHRRAGDLCAIVTATNEFVTAPIASAFGVEHLIAIELELDGEGRYTGRHTGIPSFRDGKVTRTHAWLAGMQRRLADFERSFFYSDSINDLPLLEVVTDPAVVNPDARLALVAAERHWPTVDLFGDRVDS